MSSEHGLILRQEQLDALVELVGADLRQSLEERLRRYFPETCARLGPEALETLVVFAVKDARCFGLTSPRGAACYADMMLLLGPGFADDRGPREILVDPARTEGDKIVSLYRFWELT